MLGEARMRTLFYLLPAICCLLIPGCLKHEMMSQEEVLKYNPRPEEFVGQDQTIVKPRPDTCLNAGKMYEALYKSSQDTLAQRDFAWRAKKAYQQAEQLQPHSVAAIAGLAR